MQTSRSPSSRPIRVTPKKSPTTESVQKRRKDIQKSEKAAYQALFNTSGALIVYYDLCYLNLISDISIFFAITEWLICIAFTANACYNYIVHFWPQIFMKPIVVSPAEKRLLGIQEDEFGFEIRETKSLEQEITFDELPPFEIHYSLEEDEKVSTPQKK